MSEELKKAIAKVEGTVVEERVIEETPAAPPEVRANPPDCLRCVWGRQVDEHGRWKTVYCPRRGCDFMRKGKRDER